MDAADAPRLVVVSGLTGVGKTRHAVGVAEQYDLVRMNADEWLQRLGIDLWEEDARAGIESLQWDLTQNLLACGQGVVIEWGTWSRHEREALRRRAQSLGASAELHHLHAPVEVLHRRVQRRQAESPVITREQLQAWADGFEVPSLQEAAAWDRFLSIPTATDARDETSPEVESTITTVRKA